jgi:YD repeat-containing protein
MRARTSLEWMSFVALSLFASISPPSYAEQTLNHWLSVSNVNVSSDVEAGSERIDPLSGMLTVTRRDFHLPGPAGLDIDVVRVYRSFPNGMGTNVQVDVATGCTPGIGNPQGICAIIFGAMTDPTPGPTNNEYVNGNAGTDSIRTFMPLGFGWQMHFGRVYMEGFNDGICGSRSQWKYDPNNPTATDANNNLETDLNHLPILELQDGSRRIMYLTQTAPDGVPTYLSTDLWQLKCTSSPYLLSPTGLRMDLGFSSSETDDAVFFSGTVLLGTANLWVTKITDRFGNYISITYDAPTQTIRQVTGSDGRAVTFQYINPANGQLETRLQSVTTNGRTVSYSYKPISTSYSPLTATANANFYLDTVSLPQSLSERYAYYIPADANRVHWNPKRDVLQTITTPYGGTISFDYVKQEVPGYFYPAGISNGLHNLSTAVLSMTRPVSSGGGTIGYTYTVTAQTGSNGVRVYTEANPDGTQVQKQFLLAADPSQYGLPITDKYLDASGTIVREVDRTYGTGTLNTAVECTYPGETSPPTYGSTPCTITTTSGTVQYVGFTRVFACTQQPPSWTGVLNGAFAWGNAQAGGKPVSIGQTNSLSAGTLGCLWFASPPADNFHSSGYKFDSGSVSTNGEVINTGLTGAVRFSDHRWVARLGTATNISDNIIGRGIYLWRVQKVTTSEYSGGTLASTHTWQPTAYDQYNNITSVTEYGGLGQTGQSRSTTLSYCTNVAQGVLSAMQSRTIGVSFLPSHRVLPAQTWSATMDANCMPTSVNEYGRVTNLTYNPTDTVNCPSGTNSSWGDVCSISTQTGVAGEATRIHVFQNYKRGIAQNETFPDETTLSRGVDDNGWVTSVTDQNGYPTSAQYDGLGRLLSITPPEPVSAAVTVSYQANNPNIRTVTRGSRVETQTLDGLGRNVASTVSGISTTFQFDVFGRRTFTSYPNGGSNGVKTQYDVVGRETRATNTVDGTYAQRQYSGLTTVVTDERSNTTQLGYLSFGNPDEQWLTQVYPPSVAVASYGIVRDSIGRVTALTQANIGRSFVYDAHGCIYQETHPEVGTVTYGRDSQCNVRSVTWAGTAANLYTPDAMDRVHQVSYSDGTSMLINYWPDGKVQSTGFGGVTRSYSYDKNRNLTGESLAVDGFSSSAAYGYDALDQLKTITYPMTGTVVDYSPDVLGRPTQVIAARGGSTQAIVNGGIQYYPSGFPQQLTYGNGVIGSFGISPRLWPSSIQYTAGSTTLAQIVHGFDPVGNTTSISDTTRSAYSIGTLGYDSLNRLIGVGSTGSPTCDICYDPNGNITKLGISGGASTSLAYDTSNRLSSISGARTGNYSYDARGNITADPTYGYSYDAGSRLLNVSLGANNVASYGYDAMGVRVRSKLAGASPIYTFYDHEGRALTEWDRNTSIVTEYFYLHGRQVAKRSTVPSSPTDSGSTQPIPVAVAHSLIKSSDTVSINITLPQGAFGTVTVAYGGTVLYSGTPSGGVITFPASSISTKSGCYRLTISYGGDLNYAPGQIGTVNECINFPLSAILELLLN